MNTKYIDKLEYLAILKQLSTHCITNLGKEICLNLKPFSDKYVVINALQETEEATKLIKEDTPPISNISKITYSLKILDSNGVLSLKALLELNRYFKNKLCFKRLFLFR